jgi:hypothetical protein
VADVGEEGLFSGDPSRQYYAGGGRALEVGDLASATDPELRAASDAANRTWSKLLLQIDEAFNDNPSALVPAAHSMFRLRDQALVLLANPLPDHPGGHARPTFEWTEP